MWKTYRCALLFLTAADLELADVGVQRVVVKAHAAGNGYTDSEKWN